MPDLIFISLASLASITVIIPFIMIYLGTPQQVPGGPDFSRLFSWGVEHSLVAGSYPPAFVEFSAEYPKFFLPLILLGVLFPVDKEQGAACLLLQITLFHLQERVGQGQFFCGLFLQKTLNTFPGFRRKSL